MCHPAGTFPSNSQTDSIVPLPGMSVFLVQKSATAKPKSSHEVPFSKCFPDNATSLQPVTNIEKDLSNNSRIQAFTNNPWSAVHPEVLGGIRDLNTICASGVGDKDIKRYLNCLVTDNGPTIDGSILSPQFVLATQGEAEELVEKGLVCTLQDARRKLPLEVRRMIFEKPTIAVSADEHGVHLFTNQDPTDLFQRQRARLVQDLLDQGSQASGYQPDDQCTDQEAHFAERAKKIFKIGHNHAPYYMVQIDGPTCDAFLRGDCAGIWPLTEADLSAAQSTHMDATRGSDLERVETHTSGSPTQLGKRGKVRRELSKYASRLKSKVRH